MFGGFDVSTALAFSFEERSAGLKLSSEKDDDAGEKLAVSRPRESS
jgi:hypothetical protein